VPELPDPRGTKYPWQGTRVYYAETKDPAAPGDWTLAAELQFESLAGNCGPTPNLCLLRELPDGSTPKRAASVESEQALTGDNTTGTLFCGAHITVDSLVKLEAQPIGSSDWKPAFLGVVVKAEFDLDSCTLLWHCEDYRHFMQRVVLYGRRVYDPDSPQAPTYIRGARLTFNENDRPDRYQEGPTLGDPDGDPAAHDLPLFLPPDYNRLEDNLTAGPAIPGDNGDNPWADYWLAGHIWNYLRHEYCTSPPSAIAHLGIGAFINWPEANQGDPEEGQPDYRWLFMFEGDPENAWTYCSDLAVTGSELGKAVSGLLHKCGPYDWTLVPNADGNTADIVPFNTHSGWGENYLDYIWGDVDQTVYAAEPDVTGGKLYRDRSDFYNRGYAVGRKTVVETSVTTRAELFKSGDPASLQVDATPEDTAAWLLAYKGDSGDARKYPNVYRRFTVPLDYDWGKYVFNNTKGRTVVAEVRAALSTLLTRGWAFDAITGFAPAWQRLKPLVWRNTNVGGTPTWEPLPSTIGVRVAGGACGIELSDNARTGKAPWTWNGDADNPVVYEILVTLAIETDDLLSTEDDRSSQGDRARELFLDGGNAYRPAMRINAYYPVDSEGKITTNNPASIAPIGTPAAPAKFVDRQSALDAELAYRMDMKNAVVITGSLPLWGLRFDPWPLGQLLGQIQANGEAPLRPTLDLNACIRGFRMTRKPPATIYQLDGR